MYNIGDTFKTEDGSLGLVLDSRISGVEFYERYCGMYVPYISSTTVFMSEVAEDWKYTVDSTHSLLDPVETFYYSVLIGDEKGWMELEDPETHGHEKIEGKG